MTCIICQNPSKYKCPACSFKTCSVPCVNTHKELFNCTGIRKHTRPIPIKSFTSLDLKHDLNFLQEVIKDCDHAYKTINKLTRHDTRKRFQLLLNETRSRSMNFHLLPKSMQKHLENQTLFNTSEQLIYWTIEWKWSIKPGKSISIICSNHREDLSIQTHLETSLQSFYKNPKFLYELKNSESKDYQILWNTGKSKFQNKITPIFEQIDPLIPLRSFIERVSNSPFKLIEFPTIFFTTSSHSSNFQLMAS